MYLIKNVHGKKIIKLIVGGATIMGIQAGTYGVGSGANAECKMCLADTCTISGRSTVPLTCAGIVGCADPGAAIANCACAPGTILSKVDDTCSACPPGHHARTGEAKVRTIATLSNYTRWEQEQGRCAAEHDRGLLPDSTRSTHFSILQQHTEQHLHLDDININILEFLHYFLKYIPFLHVFIACVQ